MSVDHGLPTPFVEEFRIMFLYLTLKVAMQGMVEECNRLAKEEESMEKSRWLRQVLLEIETSYQRGEIDTATYLSMQEELLRAAGISNETPDESPV